MQYIIIPIAVVPISVVSMTVIFCFNKTTKPLLEIKAFQEIFSSISL